MTDVRYEAISNPRSSAILNEEEKRLGWHFCTEWGGLLIGPGCAELCLCVCLDKDHLAYESITNNNE